MAISVWVSTSVQKSSDRTDFQTDNISLDVILEEGNLLCWKDEATDTTTLLSLGNSTISFSGSNCFFPNNSSLRSLQLQFLILREFSEYIPELPVTGSSVKSDS